MGKVKRIFVTDFPVMIMRPPTRGFIQVEQTVCFDCLTKEEKTLIKKSDDNAFQIWDEYSDGWIGSPVCDRCQLSIPVYVDGDRAKFAETAEQIVQEIGRDNGWNEASERVLALNFIDKQGTLDEWAQFLEEQVRLEMDQE